MKSKSKNMELRVALALVAGLAINLALDVVISPPLQAQDVASAVTVVSSESAPAATQDLPVL
jgi:hypothetical protein